MPGASPPRSTAASAHVSVPTTYSGAELTPFFGMTDPARRQKQGAGGPTSAPIAAIYDPLLTLSTPARVSAETGMNALAHCVEAAWSPRRTPEAEAIALAGAAAIVAALPARRGRPRRRRRPHGDAPGRLPGRSRPAERRHGRAPRPGPARGRAHRHLARPRQRRPARPRRALQRRGGARGGRRGRPQRSATSRTPPAPSTACERPSRFPAASPKPASMTPTCRPSHGCRSPTTTSPATPARSRRRTRSPSSRRPGDGRLRPGWTPRGRGRAPRRRPAARGVQQRRRPVVDHDHGRDVDRTTVHGRPGGAVDDHDADGGGHLAPRATGSAWPTSVRHRATPSPR